MDKPPALAQLSEREKDALIITWWAEVQHVQPRIAEREAKRQKPVNEARHSRVPPAQPRHTTPPTRPLQETRREAKLQDHLCHLLDEATIPPTHHSRAQAIRFESGDEITGTQRAA